MKTILLFIMLVASVFLGCTKSQIKDTLNVQDHSIGQPVITLFSVNSESDKFAKCLQRQLSLYVLDIKYVSKEKFQDALFPWFEYNTAPKEISEYNDLLRNALVRRRIEELKIDFLIYVQGVTTQSEFQGPMLELSPGAIGYQSRDRETHITTTIWNLNKAVALGDSIISVEGKVRVFAFSICIMPIPAFTESEACDETAKRISNCLKGKVSHGNE